VATKISAFLALAPVFHMTHTKSLLIEALAKIDLDSLVAFLGFGEFLPSNALFKLLLPAVCSTTPALCTSVIYLLTGFDAADFNTTRLPLYMAHFPEGVSVRELQHFCQNVRSSDGLVRKFDGGFLWNLKTYGSTSPPVWNVTASSPPPTYFFSGGNDDLADTLDMARLVSEYPAGALQLNYINKDYGHLDFVWGINAAQDIYTQVVSIANQYSGL